MFGYGELAAIVTDEMGNEQRCRQQWRCQGPHISHVERRTQTPEGELAADEGAAVSPG